MSNLAGNAASHGTAAASIAVRLVGYGNRVSLLVENDGPPVDEEKLSQFVDPLQRGLPASGVSQDPRIWDLGSKIAKAPGGTVQASSSGGKTTFGMTLRARAEFARIAPCPSMRPEALQP